VPLRFFVELGAEMMVASTMVPCFRSSPFSSRSEPISAKIARVRSCASSRCRNLRIELSSGTRSSPSSTPTKRRIDSLS
jgi:hypothetical protein